MTTTDTPDTTRLSEAQLHHKLDVLHHWCENEYQHAIVISVAVHIDTLAADLARVEKENARLREALEWYADRERYDRNGAITWVEFIPDNHFGPEEYRKRYDFGATARNALNGVTDADH